MRMPQISWEPSFCSLDRLNAPESHTPFAVGNLHSVALIDLLRMGFRRLSGWEPSFCSLDRLIGVLRLGRLVVGNLHSVALIDLQ